MNILFRIGTAVSHVTNRILCPKCIKAMQQRYSYKTSSKLYGTWEPDGLNPPPEIPEYENLHIQMKGYDFPVLESYTKYVYNTTDALGLESYCFPVPGKSSYIELFYPNSVTVEHRYNLTKYERIVQISDVPSTKIPIIIEAMRSNAPAGVEVTIKKPDPEEEENRYIPNRELIELQDKVQFIEDKKVDIRKGRY